MLQHSYAATRMVCYEKIPAVTSLVVTAAEVGWRNSCGRLQRPIEVGCIYTKIKDARLRDFTSGQPGWFPGFPREIFARVQNYRMHL